MSVNSIALGTIVRKEVTRFMRIWIQTLLPSVITMALYFIIFGHFIGSRIQGVQNFSYIQFIAPGLIMMAVMYVHSLNYGSQRIKWVLPIQSPCGD